MSRVPNVPGIPGAAIIMLIFNFFNFSTFQLLNPFNLSTLVTPKYSSLKVLLIHKIFIFTGGVELNC